MPTLDTIPIGQPVQLVGFRHETPGFRQRLLAMGLTPGAMLTVVRVAPLGDPIQIRVRGYLLSLRKRECQQIEVQVGVSAGVDTEGIGPEPAGGRLASLHSLPASNMQTVNQCKDASLISTIALVGNPNCGKTTLFNALTGSWQQVGNWAGVTVERKMGYFRFNGQKVPLVDLPGTYTLTAVAQDGPQDENLTSEFLKTQPVSLVFNIVDAANLERNLYLTVQCLEQQLPVVVALNRMDVAAKEGHVNVEKLAAHLGTPVLPIVARKGEGLQALKIALTAPPNPASFTLNYPPMVEEQIATLSQAHLQLLGTSVPRYQVIRWLEGEPLSCSLPLTQQVHMAKDKILAACGQAADVVIAATRYNYIANIVADAREAPTEQDSRPHATFYLDKFICHRYLGLPVFLGVMYALFFFAINVGGAFQDFFELSSHAIFVDQMEATLQFIRAPAWLQAFLMSLGHGISTVLTFVPVIGAMFLALAFLEDCGYMARAAFVMDRLMRAIGLPGKSFVPMIVGFGCNVPAIMGTRSLDNKRDRILAVMMSPFMSCGARLAIFTVFVAAFFPEGGQNIVFLLYLIGIGMAILTGLLLKKTLLKGEATPLVMEMPHYQWPHWRSLWFHSWHRLRRFIQNAGKLIVPVSICVGMLNSVNLQGEWLKEEKNDSVLAVMGQTITPVFAPLGMEEDNWPAAVGLLTGILAKEVVIGTLNALYGQSIEAQEEQEQPYHLGHHLKEAAATIGPNLWELGQAWRNPIAAKAPDVALQHHAYGEMVKCFNGKANAFAYLLFVLLYFPCVSATAAMVREVQRGWTIFSICWTTGLAYALAVIYYQCATFSLHPIQSTFWIIGWLGIGLMTFLGIRIYSNHYLPRVVPTRVVVAT